MDYSRVGFMNVKVLKHLAGSIPNLIVVVVELLVLILRCFNHAIHRLLEFNGWLEVLELDVLMRYSLASGGRRGSPGNWFNGCVH